MGKHGILVCTRKLWPTASRRPSGREPNESPDVRAGLVLVLARFLEVIPRRIISSQTGRHGWFHARWRCSSVIGNYI